MSRISKLCLLPQSFPNPVWPVPPQIPLQLCLTSAEASVTGDYKQGQM